MRICGIDVHCHNLQRHRWHASIGLSLIPQISNLVGALLNRRTVATFNLEAQECHATYIFLSWRHFSVMGRVIKQALLRSVAINKETAMDDYQEELLEYQAFELEPMDSADDATEL